MAKTVYLASLLLLSPSLLFAEGKVGKWHLGLYHQPLTLEGGMEERKDNKLTNFDLNQDLGIQKDGTKLGFKVEYQGPRFGLALSMGGQEYSGSKRVEREIEVGDEKYTVGRLVNSKIKLTDYDLNWTIRVYRWQQAWVGIDLGAHVWGLDMQLDSPSPVNGVEAIHSDQKLPLPIPQLGLSVGGNILDNQLVGRASFHYLGYKGASYKRFQADLRYFPLNWVGAMAFIDDERFDVPKGSASEDLNLFLNRSGVGFGVVFRL